ncbi:MAG: ZIP family metal transporter, partial [Alphaproteobacteria bacterium]
MILEGLPVIPLGAGASLAAGLATGVGALPVLFMRGCSEARERVMLAFAAGVMLAASFFSLIIPGVDVLEKGGMGPAGAAGIMAVAVLIGAGAIAALNRFVPVDHLVIGAPGTPDGLARRVGLFVLAITLHNFPEGMAVGVSFGGGDVQQGIA